MGLTSKNNADTSEILKLIGSTIDLQMIVVKQNFRAAFIQECLAKKISVKKYFDQAENVFRVIDLLLSTLFRVGTKDQIILIKDNHFYQCSSDGLKELSDNETFNIILDNKKEE